MKTETISAFVAAWIGAHEKETERAKALTRQMADYFRAGVLIDCGPVDLWAWAPKREPECVVVEKAAEQQAAHLALARKIKQMKIGEGA